ncbi:MAG: GNAT family N-acetyltransferase [Nanoarchaeota archaeon]
MKSLYGLGKQQFGGEFWFTKKFLRDAIKRGGIYFGAFDKDRLVGAIFVDMDDRPKAWVFFDVEKFHRQKGVGSLLLEAAEKNCLKIIISCLLISRKKINRRKDFTKSTVLLGRGRLRIGSVGELLG